ncbi:MAG: ChaN family lipoprotein [Rhodospirillaceae bacterium]|nr:ChaN family lipoprotein [Rhodospirillales bacterium]
MRPRVIITILAALLVSPALTISAASPALAAESLPAFTTTTAAANPLVGKVWLPPSNEFIAVDELVRRAQAADAVLLGETHDNPDHHVLQAWMLRRVLESGKRPLVAFEMFDSSQQERLDKYLTENPLDAAGLGPAVAWEKTGWPAWSNYRPIAEAALLGGSTLATANLAKADLRRIAKGDIPETLSQLGLDTPLAPAVQQAMEQEIAAGHCGMLPTPLVPGMVQVQRARDAIMARAVADGLVARGSAVLIAGAGHTRSDRGVPAQLAAIAPAKRSLAIAFLEVREDKADPATYGELFDTNSVPFDAVWFTPRAEREDQCEGLKKHLEKKAG